MKDIDCCNCSVWYHL